MEDNGSKYTDKEINKLEKKIKKVYSEAQSDIEDKLDDFFQKFDAKNNIYQQKLKDGEITQDQFQQWIKGQVFQSKQWQAKKDQIINTVQNANKEASNMVNGGTIDVFAENANWSHYEMEHTEGVNFGFGIYDSHAVTNLIKNDPQLLPKWKVNEKKDYVWNGKKVDNAITQAIIQGEGLGDIATRIASALGSNNRNTMLTFARTAMTGAQNAGRFQGLMDAKELGIDVVKVWMATLDDHTRVSHREIDGEEQKVGDKWHPFKFSNGCRYPGDPLGPAHEVYNCRCTLVSDIKGYPSKFQRYDNIAGVPVDQMTYKEWKEAKEALSLLPKVDYSEFGTKEAYEIIAKYKDQMDFVGNATGGEWEILDKAGIPIYSLSDNDMEKINNLFEKVHNTSDKPKEDKHTTPKNEYSEFGGKEVYDILSKYETAYQWEWNGTFDEWDIIQQHFPDLGGGDLTNKIEELINKIHTSDAQKPVEQKPEEQKPVEQKIDYDKYGGKEVFDAISKYKSIDDLFENVSEEDYKTLIDAGFDVFGGYDPDLSEQLQELMEMAQDELKDHSEAVNIGSVDSWIDECMNGPSVKEMLRQEEEVFDNITPEQQSALRTYTGSSYSQMNQYYRNIGGGMSEDEARDILGERLYEKTMLCHEAFEGNELKQDMILRRGTDVGDLAGLFMSGDFDSNMEKLSYKTPEELNDMFQGQVGTYYGFTSTSSQWDRGFSGDVEIILHAPKGTSAMSIMKISQYGTDEGETLLRDNTRVICEKIEESDGHKGSDIRVYLTILPG